MKNKNLSIVALSLLLVIIAAGANTAFALPQPPPDLQVEWQGPSSSAVKSPYLYTVKVKNLGKSASGVKVIVEFPLTNTSPTKYILGNLSGLSNGCSVVSNKLECNLSTINKNRTSSFSFTFEIPVTTQTRQFRAPDTTTTAGETNLQNNTATFTPSLSYPSNQIISANLLNSHCTGQSLTSYFECEKFPGSIMSHSATLVSGGSVDLGMAGYGGSWYQTTPQQLYFNYTENNVIVAEFNGFATSATCFEGITTFPQNLNYNSAYKVCIQ